MQMHAVSAADARAMSESGATQPGCHGMERTEAMAWSDSAPCGHDDAVAALSVGATRSDVLAAAGIHTSGLDAGALIVVSCAERGQIDAGCERLSPHRFIPLRL